MFLREVSEEFDRYMWNKMRKGISDAFIDLESNLITGKAGMSTKEVQERIVREKAEEMKAVTNQYIDLQVQQFLHQIGKEVT